MKIRSLPLLRPVACRPVLPAAIPMHTSSPLVRPTDDEHQGAGARSPASRHRHRQEGRAFVTNLTAKDFTLTEDGRPEVIKSFTTQSNLPFRLGLLVDTSRSVYS